MAQVRWAPQAADDLEAICLFIARDAPGMAAVFADRVIRATERLAGTRQAPSKPLALRLVTAPSGQRLWGHCRAELK